MFDAARWVAMAKDAGMKYIVPVTKHHDGFCMWHSKFTEYGMQNTPFKRDIIAELARETHRAGLKLGFYYSQRDWSHPDYSADLPRYNEYMRNQIRELLTNFGEVSVMWFDAGNYPGSTWEREKLVRLIGSLQPNILINNRTGVPGDFTTPEGKIGTFSAELDWESCMTFSALKFSWHGFDVPVITFPELIRRLVHCSGGDGNLLMNVDPLPTGDIHPEEVARMAEAGKWLRTYGESIYDTRGGPWRPGEWGAATHCGRTAYIHVLDWTKMPARLPAVPQKLTGHSVLTRGEARVTQTAAGIEIDVPGPFRSEPDTILKLEFDGELTA